MHRSYRPQAVAGGGPGRAPPSEILARAKRPVFYTGGGVMNSGPRASELLTELVGADRLSDHEYA